MAVGIKGWKNPALFFALIITAFFGPWQALAGTVSPPEAVNKPAIRHIIIVIGDGMGAPQRQAAREYLKHTKRPAMVMDALPVQGQVNTRSLSGITDTIAADTALLTGFKTQNGLPFMSPEGARYTNALEHARQKGWATGILTTSFLDSLSSLKSKNQGSAMLLALQAANGVDLLVANTTIKPDVLARNQMTVMMQQMGYKVAAVPREPARLLAAADLAKPLVGLQYNDKTYEIDRGTEGQTTAGTVETVLNRLDKNPRGFVFILHSGQIDKAAHSGDLAAQTREVLALDRSVGVCRSYYTKHSGDTVLVVVGDHETGKLALNPKKNAQRPVLLARLKASLDKMSAQYVAVGGDPMGYLHYLKNVGLGPLTKTEVTKLNLSYSSRGKTTPANIVKALKSIINNRAGAAYSGTGHSDQMVPVSALGSGTQKLSGSIDNTDIGRFLVSLITGKDPAENIQVPSP